MRRSRRWLTVPVAALLIAGAFSPTTAAGRAGGGEADTASGTTTTVRVKMKDDFFRPRTVTISRGSKVRWINRGERIHTTTGSTWSATLAPGERFTKRFRRAGTYAYSCTLHPGMTGTVVVT